jgi:hypothetical protein
MTRVAAPKVPGEISAPESEVPGETVTVEKSRLDALLAQVADLSNKVRTIEAGKPVTGKRVNPTENLPDAASVDVNALKSPVLTKQGWLVPDTFGSNPNAPKAF